MFSRLEILSTPLHCSSTPENFAPVNYLLECSQCVEEHETPGRRAGGECPMLEKARENLHAVLD